MLPTAEGNHVNCPTVSINPCMCCNLRNRDKIIFIVNYNQQSFFLSPICVSTCHEKGKEKHVDSDTDPCGWTVGIAVNEY